MNEIDNTDLFVALRNRRLRLMRQLEESINLSERINRMVEAFLDSDPEDGNWPADSDCKRMGNVVQQEVLQTGGDRGQAHPDGEREATGRPGDDVRLVDNRGKWLSPISKWAACTSMECENWGICTGCLDRQRAGECPALSWRDR